MTTTNYPSLSTIGLHNGELVSPEYVPVTFYEELIGLGRYWREELDPELLPRVSQIVSNVYDTAGMAGYTLLGNGEVLIDAYNPPPVTLEEILIAAKEEVDKLW